MTEQTGAHAFKHPVLALVDTNAKTVAKVDTRLSQVGLSVTALQMVTGSEAFRDFNPLTNAIGQSKALNFRGMVVSAKWRSAFRLSSQAGEYLDNLGYISGIAAGLAEAAPQIDAIRTSSDTPTLKSLQLSAIAGTIAERTLLGVIPAGTHLIYKSLEGWCMIAGLLGATSLSNQGIQILTSADTLVQTTYNTVTNTSVQGAAVWTVIDFVTSPKGGQ